MTSIWVAVPTPFAATTVTSYVPVSPAVGVPEIAAVPLVPAEKVNPAGNTPDSLTVAIG